MRYFLIAFLVVFLISCSTTGNLPGIIGGEKGEADWCLSLDLAIIDPVSVCFKGKRTAEKKELTEVYAAVDCRNSQFTIVYTGLAYQDPTFDMVKNLTRPIRLWGSFWPKSNAGLGSLYPKNCIVA